MKKVLLTIAISVFLSVLLLVGYDIYFNKKDKVAFIRIGKVLQEYKGMHEADKQYEQETKMVQANIDTLQNRYEKLLIQEKELGGNNKELSYEIGVTRSEYEKYNNKAYEDMQIRKNELTQQIITKINSFVENYGKTNEYRMIFGATTSGSIMYGIETDDITKDIIDQLNSEYDLNINKTE